MKGIMQDWPLTVDKILDHAKNWHGHREVVTRSVEGPIIRTTYAEIHARSKRVSRMKSSNSAKSSSVSPGNPTMKVVRIASPGTPSRILRTRSRM